MKIPSSASRFTKIIITLERHGDGRLRVYSKDVPGFVLSGYDNDAIMDDIKPALETILSSMWGVDVVASKLVQWLPVTCSCYGTCGNEAKGQEDD